MKRSCAFIVVLLIGWGGLLQSVWGATVYWTDWTTAMSGLPGVAMGTITVPGSSDISVEYHGEIRPAAQTEGGTNYWVPNTPFLSTTVDNAPSDSDIIRLTGGNAIVNTLTFGTPVVNPVVGIVSLGRPSVAVRYEFNAPFDILSFGPGFWGGPGTLTELPGNVLQGVEGHGVIQFPGVVRSISWTAPDAEFWHGFTVGTTAVVPAPTSAVLLGSGLLAFSGLRWRQTLVAKNLTGKAEELS